MIRVFRGRGMSWSTLELCLSGTVVKDCRHSWCFERFRAGTDEPDPMIGKCWQACQSDGCVASQEEKARRAGTRAEKHPYEAPLSFSLLSLAIKITQYPAAVCNPAKAGHRGASSYHRHPDKRTPTLAICHHD